MRLRFALPLLMMASVASAQNTPEAALQRLVAAWNRHDLRGVAAEVYGADTRKDFSVAGGQLGSSWPKITIFGLRSDVGRGSAKISFTTRLSEPARAQAKIETISARIVNGKWKLVPVAPSPDPAIVPTIAYMVVHPEILKTAGRAALGTVALSNAKQLALACIMYSADNDDRFAFNAGNFRSKLGPYVRNESLWTLPGEPKGSTAFAINAAIMGKGLSAIAEPSRVVMVYEGKNGKLSFRHDGRAAVGFVDGHAKLVGAAEARSLRWKP